MNYGGDGDHPRVRGDKAEKDGLAPPWKWITPACAGISKIWQEPTPEGKDHPRVRGDKRCLALLISPRTGSPPRARG